MGIITMMFSQQFEYGNIIYIYIFSYPIEKVENSRRVDFLVRHPRLLLYSMGKRKLS